MKNIKKEYKFIEKYTYGRKDSVSKSDECGPTSGSLDELGRDHRRSTLGQTGGGTEHFNGTERDACRGIRVQRRISSM